MQVHKIDKASPERNNAASFVYQAVYGRKPPVGFLPAQTGSETDVWEGIEKDVHLKNIWISTLNKIENIQVLSTCEGHNNQNLTHIIFRYIGKRKLDDIYEKLNTVGRGLEGTKCIAIETDIGICFVLTTYEWYKPHIKYNKNWEKWWKRIIPHIHVAVNYS